jgi:hypothetical protein
VDKSSDLFDTHFNKLILIIGTFFLGIIINFICPYKNFVQYNVMILHPKLCGCDDMNCPKNCMSV